MKLTAKILLKPTDEQKQILLDTMQEANAACDSISEWAFNNKIFGQFKIHHCTYYTIKSSFNLSAQMVVRCIAKVCNSYKVDRKRQRSFRKYGLVSYDSRIMSYKDSTTAAAAASIWTIQGRQKIPFVTGKHHAELLKYGQGEADLAYVKRKFYLLQTCDVPHKQEQEFDDCIGVDLGITNIATIDDVVSEDVQIFGGKELNRLREHRQKVCSSLQSKGTKNSKRILKRLSGKERTTVKIQNHTIAKAIAVENLKGIRSSPNKRLRKSQRGLHNCWSFYQLQSFISYKAKREGIPVYFVPSYYTSKTCNNCKKIGIRNGEKFSCNTCGTFHADVNAAKNIANWGRSVIRPENSTLFCDIIDFVGHLRQC